MSQYTEEETKDARQHLLILCLEAADMTQEVMRDWFAAALRHVPFVPNSFSFLRDRTLASVGRRPKGVEAVLAALAARDDAMDTITSEIIHGKNYHTSFGSLTISKCNEMATLNYLASAFSLEDALRFLRHLPPRPKLQTGLLTFAYGGMSAVSKSLGGTTAGRATPLEIERARALQEFERKKLYQKGRLHDVYPLVILNPAQAAYDLGGITLREWIAKGERGSLEPLQGDLLIWRVPEGEIEQVRQALLPTGALCIAR